MKNFGLSKITVNHQVTIPQEIFDYLKLEVGDQVLFTLNEKSQVVLSSAQDVLEAQKLAARPGSVKVAVSTRGCPSNKLRKLI